MGKYTAMSNLTDDEATKIVGDLELLARHAAAGKDYELLHDWETDDFVLMTSEKVSRFDECHPITPRVWSLIPIHGSAAESLLMGWGYEREEAEKMCEERG